MAGCSTSYDVVALGSLVRRSVLSFGKKSTVGGIVRIRRLIASKVLLVSGVVAVLSMLTWAAPVASGAGAWHPPVTVGHSLLAVDFPSISCGWAVGQNGTILATSDGGGSWSTQFAPTGDDLRGVSFVDDKNGWAVGGDCILHTDNGGKSWTKTIWLGAGSVRLKAVSFYDANDGMVVGSDAGNGGYGVCVILVTHNGGLSWTDYGASVPTDHALGFNSVAYVDSDHAWGTNHGVVWGTADGGQTWAPESYVHPYPAPTYPYYRVWFNSVTFENSQDGWAVGEAIGVSNPDWTTSCTTIFATTNGGATWTRQAQGSTTGYLNAVSFTDASRGWAVGLEGYGSASAPIVYSTADGGANWSSQYTGGKNYPYAISFPDADHGWIVGGGDIQSYGNAPSSDPVVALDGSSATQLPVLVLVAGLNADTGFHVAAPLNWTFGWKMNAPDHLGDPWAYIGQQTVWENLGACKLMVMPTAEGASGWPQDARDAGYVIDSSGHLAYNMKQLAAWLTKQQADGEFGDHPVILVCHSYGGVIARSMLASDTLQDGPARNAIAGIIQLGSPNGGSGVADYANAHPVQAFFFGRKSDATVDLSTGAMKKWNGMPAHQHPVGVPVVRFAGEYLPSALSLMMNDTSQLVQANFLCSQHHGNSGLTCHNDGMVASDSVKDALGTLANPRRDFGEQVAGQLFAPNPVLSHATGLPGTDRTYNDLTIRALVPQPSEGSSAPLFSSLKNAIAHIRGLYSSITQKPVLQSRGQVGAAKVPPAVQGSSSNALPECTVFVSSGSSASATLSLDAPANIVVSSSSGLPTVTVHDATGAILQTPTWSNTGTGGVATTIVRLDTVNSGNYSFDISLPPTVSGNVTLAGTTDGGALLDLVADGSPYVGDSAALGARFVSASGQPLLGATVTGVAQLSGTNDVALTFHDDGLSPDATAGDGVYAASFTPPVAGRWLVRVSAGLGSAARVASIIVDAGASVATVTGSLSEVTQQGPGTTFASFGVQVPLKVSEAGTYTVSAPLMDANGTDVGTLLTSADLAADQSTTLTASIDGAQLSGIATGALTVGTISITRYTDGVELNAGDAPGFTTMRSYAASDFYNFAVSLNGPAANPSRTQAVHFSGTAVDTASTIASVEYTIDGGLSWHLATPTDGAFDANSESYTIDFNLPDYVYGIVVRAKGADGTVLPVADCPGVRFIVDTAAPASVPDLTASAETLNGTPLAHVSWLPSESAQYTVSSVSYTVALDGTKVGSTYGTNFDVTGVGSGTHTLTVTPIDDAGNIGLAQSTSVVVDTTPPTTLANADDLWHNTEVTITLTPTDETGGSGMVGGHAKTEYKLDSADWTTGAEVLIPAPVDHSNDGEHTLLYRSTDAAGNVEATKSATVRIDTIAPAGTFTLDGGAATTTTATVNVASAVTDAHGHLQMRFSVDGMATWTAWEDYAADKTISLPGGNGSKIVNAQYRDAAGNVLDLSQTIDLVSLPDLIPPTVTMTGATNQAWYRDSVRVTSGVASITYVLDGTKTTVLAASRVIDIPALPNGAHLLTFHATDNATNTCSDQSVHFFIDTIGPVAAARNVSVRRGIVVRLRYMATDNLSPTIWAPVLVVKNSRGRIVKVFRTTVTTSRLSRTWYSIKWRPTVKGIYRYYVYVKDLAGNAQSKVGSARIIVR